MAGGKIWLRWYWRLSTLGKLIATVAEIIGLQVALGYLRSSGASPLSLDQTRQVVIGVSVSLMVLFLVAVLWSGITGK